MSFQKTVNLVQPLGVEGTIAKNQFKVTESFLAEGDDVTVGRFCYAGTNAETQVLGLDAEATEVVGLVVFNGMQLGARIANDQKVINGREVAVMLKGYAYVKSTTTSKRGQHVIVVKADNTIKTGDSALEGELDTGFTVQAGAGANEVCLIGKI